MMGGHKEIYVKAKPSPTDALVDQLNQELEAPRSCSEPRPGSAPARCARPAVDRHPQRTAHGDVNESQKRAAIASFFGESDYARQRRGSRKQETR